MEEKVEQQSFVFTGMLAKWHVQDKLTEVYSHTPSNVESLEETQMFAYDGASDDKKGSKPTKKKSTLKESTYARYAQPLCSKKKSLEDEWVEIWTVHSGRYKLLRNREGGILHDGKL